MLVNIEGVAQPADAHGIREIVPYVYTSTDSRETPSEVRDANHAREIVKRLCIPESVRISTKAASARNGSAGHGKTAKIPFATTAI